MATDQSTSVNQQVDKALALIAEYASDYTPDSAEALKTARWCLADTLGCGILALNYLECTKLLGPIIPGTVVPHGSRVPGTPHILDPVQAAFNIGAMIRWLDFNDTWLAAEWGHPSDNLGGILAVADYLSQNGENITVKDLLIAMIKAHEIQGGLALENSYNRVGFDHVALVKIATTAIVTKMLGGSKDQILNALSNAFIDVGPLRTYRHAPNTGSRKSWAAGDATSRGVQLALLTLRGEMGYPSALSAKRWGLYDVLFSGKPFTFQRPLTTYVMENVLFKIAFPAEFHAQTAVECAFKLHPKVKDRLEDIERIEIETHESALRIIDKTGPLKNPADRDHCMQYMVAIGLLFGELTADHYEEDVAKDPRIDSLREKMLIMENTHYSKDYHDPEKRSITNALTIFFEDDTHLGPIEVEYPVGHRRRRKEGIPLLLQKFEKNLLTRFDQKKVNKILDLFHDSKKLEALPVHQFVQLFCE